VYVNLVKKPDWLFERNPRGLVPVLEYKGLVISESAAIDEYLEDEFPAYITGTHALLPSARDDRAAVNELLQKFDKVCCLKTTIL